MFRASRLKIYSFEMPFNNIDLWTVREWYCQSLSLWDKRAKVGIIFLRTICSSAHPLQRNRPSQTGRGGSWTNRTPAPSQLWLWVSLWLQCDVFVLHFLRFCSERKLRTWDWVFHFLCQQVQQVFMVFRLSSWNMFTLQFMIYFIASL